MHRPSGVALPLLVSLAALACSSAEGRPPNLVLIVVDTLRADRLSCYGYARHTSPRIDAIAARGIRFANASSTSSWTLPAHASLFTGLHAIHHGATQEHPRLSQGPATLAELLAAHGYATMAASANPLVSEQTGLARGFERFAGVWRRSWQRRARGRHPVQVAVEELFADLPAGRPWFLFVNFIEPHAPYRPPEPYRSRWHPGPSGGGPDLGVARFYLDPEPVPAERLALEGDLYDGEVSRADELVGALVDFLASGGRLENALLVVTSDHGESLGEHRHLRHVFNLYNPVVRIPLIAVLPDGRRAGEVVDRPVSLVDVFVSVLARAGIAPPPDPVAGRDVFAGAFRDAPVFAEYYYPLQVIESLGEGALARHADALRPYLRRLRSVRHEGLRLIASSDGRRELYDVARDPGEQRDLAGDARGEHLQALLDAFVERGGGQRPLPDAGAPGAVFGDLDEETAESLRELGYLR